MRQTTGLQVVEEHATDANIAKFSNLKSSNKNIDICLSVLSRSSPASLFSKKTQTQNSDVIGANHLALLIL